MEVIYSKGNKDLAMVYAAKLNDGSLIEFVESIQPPLPREKKWVLIISVLKGCPVRCLMCDAGGYYKGKLSAEKMWFQINTLIQSRFSNSSIEVERLKIQFARMGDPAFNEEVITVLEELPQKLNVPIIIPSISTIAPVGTDKFFKKLLQIKQKYPLGSFQMQFSIHSTNEKDRFKLVPVKTWEFSKMAEYGESFYKNGDRKITLNFAVAKGFEVDPSKLKQFFSPEKFIIKLTPINPTLKSEQFGLKSFIDPDDPATANELIFAFNNVGYEVILSIGETEENQIGSNCGMYVNKILQHKKQSVC